MEDYSNKILAITSVTNGVCVNDQFIALVDNLASSMGRIVDYFRFNKSANFREVDDLCDKDILDRLINSISRYDFMVIDKRLDLPTLNVVIGLVLSEGCQIGSFYIDDPDLQEFLESEVLLRKSASYEKHELLTVSPEGVEESKNIEEALNCLITDEYLKIKFLEGNYNMSFLYRVLAYCYDTGVIVVDSKLPEGVYIKIIESKC